MSDDDASADGAPDDGADISDTPDAPDTLASGDRDPFVEMNADSETGDERVDTETNDQHAGNEAVVPKRSYCERCRHFAAPPDVRCTHPGTDIVELVDMAHVRVTNCPVVAHRQSVTDSRDGSGGRDRDRDRDVDA